MIRTYVALSFEVYICNVYSRRRTNTSACVIILGGCTIYAVDTQLRRQGYGLEQRQGSREPRPRRWCGGILLIVAAVVD